MFNGEHTMSTSEILAMTESGQASLYTVSTNATDDNLPGAGRTLGLLYSFAGRHLEVQLGRLAERLGRGPRATALRIQKNSEIVTLASVLPQPLSMVKYRTKKIEKDCKRLLRYVGSNATSTREQALDHIIDLSFDHHVRDLLKFMGAAQLIELAHKELFVRGDYNASLLSRSRKALVSVTDDMLMQELRDVKRKNLSIYFNRASNVWAYVRDPDRSPIVVRWLVRLGRLVFLFPSMPILDCLNVVVGTSPEWESVDQLLNSLLGFFKSKTLYFFDDITKTLEIIIRHADKLPRTVGSGTFQWLMEDFPLMKDHAMWTVSLLRSLARPKNAVSEDFSCIDCDHVRDLYPHSALRPLFARLLNVPDLIFYQIIHEKIGGNSWSDEVHWVIQSETLMRRCEELAFFTDSEDQLLSNRARRCVASLLAMDIYCRTAILRALSTTRYARTTEFALLIETQQVRNFAVNNKSPWFYRHCDADGKLVHVCPSYCTESRVSKEKYILEAKGDALLKLRVQRGEAFSSAGYHPIVAGRTANGELAYVAKSYFSKFYDRRLYAVTEGMKPEDLHLEVQDWRTRRNRMRAPEYFVVYVLRYEPTAYARNGYLNGYGTEGLDPTGPFAWRSVKQEDMELSVLPLAFAEEVQADREGSGSDEKAWKKDNEGNESDEEAWETADEGSLFSSN